jgi:hypothetical protein
MIAAAHPDNRRRAIGSSIGWRRLDFDDRDGSLLQPGGVSLDFSGIAKGFAVDHGVDALRAFGLTDLLFEIGGELRGPGRRPGGAPRICRSRATPLGAWPLRACRSPSPATVGIGADTRTGTGRARLICAPASPWRMRSQASPYCTRGTCRPTRRPRC